MTDTVRNAVTITWAAFRDPPVSRAYQVVSPAKQLLADFLEQVWDEFNNTSTPSREPNMPSLSVGDVVSFWNRHFVAATFGFRELIGDGLKQHLALPRRDRSWVSTAIGPEVPAVTTAAVVLGAMEQGK